MTWTKINALSTLACILKTTCIKTVRALTPTPYKIDIANMFAKLLGYLNVSLVQV